MKERLPLILSGLALALAGAMYFRSGPEPSSSPPDSDGIPALPSAVPSTPAPPPGQDAQPAHPKVQVAQADKQDDGDTELLQTIHDRFFDMEEMFLEIENRLFSMEKRLSQMRDGWEGLARRGLVPLTQEDALKFQRQAADPSLSTEERLSALSLLRRHDALTDKVVTSMTQLAQTTTDPRVREQIYGHMDGLSHAALQAPLLAAVSSEQDAGARARAADALSAFSTDPSVQTWLRHLAENDPDERVRRESRQALNERLGRMEPEGLQQVVMSADTSTSEKLEATGRLRRENAASPEIVATMLGLYASSTDPNIRADVFRQLDGVSDPALRDPLLLALAEDDNARVREEAADALSAFRDDPDVAEWLQHVAQNDPNPRVQHEAQSALEGQEGQRGGGRGRR